MEILGITLQLVAGVIFGLDYLVPRTWMIKANKALRWFIFLPYSRRKYILSAIIWVGILFPGFASLYYFLIRYQAVEGEWFVRYFYLGLALILFLLITTVIVVVYFSALKGASHIVRKSKQFRNLVDGDSYLISLVSNGLLFVVFTLVVGLFILIPRLTGAKETILGLLELPRSAFAYAFGALWGALLLIGVIALAVLIIGGVIKLLQLLAKAKRGALWPIALFVYVAGGVLLLVNACQPK